MSEPHEVSEPANIHFLVMDSRIDFDIASAEILETIGTDYVNYERVWARFLKDWSERDARLVACRFLGKGETRFFKYTRFGNTMT